MIPANMVLVLACSKNKVNLPSGRAGDFYTGTIHKKGKAIAQAVGLPIWILSAKYGFIHPDTIIEQYDEKFKKPYAGPFPPAPWHGFYLGGSLYFKNMPQSFQPLVKPQQIGYMLSELTVLEKNPARVWEMIRAHKGA